MAHTIVHRAAGNGIGLIDESALLFVRDRRLTKEALDALERIADDLLPRQRGPIGILASVPGDAGLSKNDLLDRQRKLIGRFRALHNVHFAFCVFGDSTQAMAMRTVVRLFVLGNKNARLFSDEDEAARFVAERAGLDVAALRDALVELRAQETR